MLLNILALKIDMISSLGFIPTLSAKQHKITARKTFKTWEQFWLFGSSLPNLTQSCTSFLLYMFLSMFSLAWCQLYPPKQIAIFQDFRLETFYPKLWTTVKVGYCRLLITLFALCFQKSKELVRVLKMEHKLLVCINRIYA